MSNLEEKCTMPRKEGRTEGRKKGRKEGRKAEVSIPAGSQGSELVTSL